MSKTVKTDAEFILSMAESYLFSPLENKNMKFYRRLRVIAKSLGGIASLNKEIDRLRKALFNSQADNRRLIAKSIDSCCK